MLDAKSNRRSPCPFGEIHFPDRPNCLLEHQTHSTQWHRSYTLRTNLLFRMNIVSSLCPLPSDIDPIGSRCHWSDRTFPSCDHWKMLPTIEIAFLSRPDFSTETNCSTLIYRHVDRIPNICKMQQRILSHFHCTFYRHTASLFKHLPVMKCGEIFHQNLFCQFRIFDQNHLVVHQCDANEWFVFCLFIEI